MNGEGIAVRRQLPLLQANETESWSGSLGLFDADFPAWLRVGRGIGIVLCGSAFVALCARVALPLFFTPVPLSLVTFAVIVVGLVLSPRMAFLTLGAYLAEGAMGLPVFGPTSGAPTGVAHLFGPTGGYLLSYPLVAWMVSFLFRRLRDQGDAARGFAAAAFSGAAGHLLILLSGAMWLAMLSRVSFGAVLGLAVIPFLPGDALKVMVAAGLVAGWVRLRRVAQ
jgi:biotin transport system substrate-specific component